METKARDFADHWQWAAAKGIMNKNTAAGLRAACSQVLSVLEDWENVDIKSLNVEDALRRFQNLKKKDFKPNVLEAYKRRFRQAVTSYLSYLEDPAGWRPRTIEKNTSLGKPERMVPDLDNAGKASKHEMPQVGLVEYPFPLRDGQIARLILPRDLKSSEVRRLSAFMQALAVDFDPSVVAA